MTITEMDNLIDTHVQNEKRKVKTMSESRKAREEAFNDKYECRERGLKRTIKKRECLSCGREFKSTGKLNRMCEGCRRHKGDDTYCQPHSMGQG